MDDDFELLSLVGSPDGDGLGFAAYSAARERFFARLRAESELRRLEALWAMAEAIIVQVERRMADDR
jgi:hypothetical protein